MNPVQNSPINLPDLAGMCTYPSPSCADKNSSDYTDECCPRPLAGTNCGGGDCATGEYCCFDKYGVVGAEKLSNGAWKRGSAIDAGQSYCAMCPVHWWPTDSCSPIYATHCMTCRIVGMTRQDSTTDKDVASCGHVDPFEGETVCDIDHLENCPPGEAGITLHWDLVQASGHPTTEDIKGKYTTTDTKASKKAWSNAFTAKDKVVFSVLNTEVSDTLTNSSENDLTSEIETEIDWDYSANCSFGGKPYTGSCMETGNPCDPRRF